MCSNIQVRTHVFATQVNPSEDNLFGVIEPERISLDKQLPVPLS